MMIEVLKTIADLEYELAQAKDNCNQQMIEQIEFALKKLRELQNFGSAQEKKEERYG